MIKEEETSIGVKNIGQMSNLFNVSPNLCRTKPLHYLSWLVGHEGNGSVLSLLRKKYVLKILLCQVCTEMG